VHPEPPEAKRFAPLRRRSDFDRVFRQGAHYPGRRITVHIAASPSGRCRLGVVVTRKTGGAVRRNRFKRLVRAAFRNEVKEIASTWDVVVVVHPRPDEGMHPIAAELAKALARHRRARCGTA